jgi:hypothetical protein
MRMLRAACACVGSVRVGGVCVRMLQAACARGA